MYLYMKWYNSWTCSIISFHMMHLQIAFIVILSKLNVLFITMSPYWSMLLHSIHTKADQIQWTGRGLGPTHSISILENRLCRTSYCIKCDTRMIYIISYYWCIYSSALLGRGAYLVLWSAIMDYYVSGVFELSQYQAQVYILWVTLVMCI